MKSIKVAYPQNEFGVEIEAPRNVQKWMIAMQKIYAEALTIGWKNALDSVTSGWETMETIDFKNWVKFYQENAHSKYKTAQFVPNFDRYIDNGPGSFIPVDAIKATLPKAPDMTAFDQQQAIDAAKAKELENNTRRQLVTDKLRALISRLSSAEKLAALPDVQRELHKVLPNGITQWFTTLQELKREIQLVPIRSASFIDDLIYKNANRLYAMGDVPAGKLLIKISQMGTVSPPAPSNPMGVPSMNPIDTTMGGQPVGMGDGPPTDLGAGPLGSPPIGGAENDPDPVKDKTMQDFVKLLSSPDENDINEIDESDENDYGKNNSDELVVEDNDDIQTKSEYKNARYFVRTAQTMAPTVPMDPSASVSDSEVPEPVNVTPDVVPQTALPADVTSDIAPINPAADSTQDPFDQALSNVKISDIISRLEGIASMFKNRQIARQLSIIDLMMDKVGIAPFFPTLAEAMRSALESNQYCQSRIEEVLAKLRGTVSTPMSQQMEGEVSGANANNEEVVKANLAKDEQQEKERKERRKQQQIAEEDAGMTPSTPPTPPGAPVGNELAGPATIESAPPVRPAV